MQLVSRVNAFWKTRSTVDFAFDHLRIDVGFADGSGRLSVAIVPAAVPSLVIP